MEQIVITAVGPDRPGLVDALTGYLYSLRANVADARMVNMRGQFAVILLAEIDEQNAATASKGLVLVGKEVGLTVTISPAKKAGETSANQLPSLGSSAVSSQGGLAFRLKTYAMDQPGIVHRVTHLLHLNGVNIEELSTRLEAGSYTGTPLFTMELRMTLPPTLPIKKLRAEIEALCDELNCDMELEPD